jgi:hypothetical protein
MQHPQLLRGTEVYKNTTKLSLRHYSVHSRRKLACSECDSKRTKSIPSDYLVKLEFLNYTVSFFAPYLYFRFAIRNSQVKPGLPGLNMKLFYSENKPSDSYEVLFSVCEFRFQEYAALCYVIDSPTLRHTLQLASQKSAALTEVLQCPVFRSELSANQKLPAIWLEKAI